VTEGRLAGHDDRLRILGVPVDAVTFEGMLDRIAAWVAAGDGLHQICTVSPEFVMIAQGDPEFMRVLREADLCVADGVGLLFAARFLGRPLPERVTGSDGVPLIAARAARTGWKLFLLGAAPGVAEKAAVRSSPACRSSGPTPVARPRRRRQTSSPA